MTHGVRLTPLRIATLAREMSAKLTGRLSAVFSRTDFVVLVGGDGSSLLDMIVSSSETAEKGRGVAMGYLKPAAARALARFDADFLRIDETTAIDVKLLAIALGVDANRLRIILAVVCVLVQDGREGAEVE